jgi:hypothetical protein
MFKSGVVKPSRDQEKVPAPTPGTGVCVQFRSPTGEGDTCPDPLAAGAGSAHLHH